MKRILCIIVCVLLGGLCRLSAQSSGHDYIITRTHLDAAGTRYLDAVQQVSHFYPFGGVFGDSSSATLQRFKFSDKEQDFSIFPGWYDFGARYYDPALCRWIGPDPLAGKYPAWSPYAYCGNSPAWLVDPDGKAMGDLETILFGLRHPRIALAIGRAEKGETNISTNAVRFATRGELLHGSNPKEQEKRGSEAGAFRHVLWQATITNKYGVKIAKEVGDAHEDKPNTIDFSKRSYSTITEADLAVDLMNNQIGRGLITDPQDNMNDIALKVLTVFETIGLYTLRYSEEGQWMIERTKLPKERAEVFRAILLQLDKNGFFENEK